GTGGRAMSYREINTDRFNLLLSHGLSAEEMLNFFRVNRTQLILAGDKQHMPSEAADAIRRIVRFKDKAHGLLGAWLKRQPHRYSETLRTQLVPRFRSMDTEGVVYSDDEFADLCRCGLVEL